jgi:hypothetical protein
MYYIIDARNHEREIYHYSLRNDSEERGSLLLRGGTLKLADFLLHYFSFK